MLATYSDDTLVILIRYMEGDRSGHLLLDEVKSVLSSVVLCSTNVNIEVVFVEAIEDNLDVAYTNRQYLLQGDQKRVVQMSYFGP